MNRKNKNMNKKIKVWIEKIMYHGQNKLKYGYKKLNNGQNKLKYEQ